MHDNSAVIFQLQKTNKLKEHTDASKNKLRPLINITREEMQLLIISLIK